MGQVGAGAQHHASGLEHQGQGGSICMQAASLVGEAGLACSTDESGKGSSQGMTMNGKHGEQ